MLVRNILLAIGAVALLVGATLGAVLIFRPPARGGAGANGPQSDVRAAVLVTVHPILAGSLLRNEDVAWRDVGAGKPPAQAIVRGQSDQIEILGAATRRALAVGEPLSNADLVRPGERDFLAAALTPGNRAVTIAVDAAQSASGLLLAGDRVDVVLVQDLSQGSRDLGHKTVGEVTLENARVVAVDRTLAGASKPVTLPGAPSAEPRTVTLDVAPVDAQRLLVAGRLGKLELSLRSLIRTASAGPAPGPVWAGDVSPALRSVPSSPQASGSTSEATPAAHLPKTSAPDPAQPRVLILRGAKTETQ
jgi:pilus assembly protein CpaB